MSEISIVPAPPVDSQQKPLMRLSEGTVLLAILTLAGYALAYRYESGSCKFYGIPEDCLNLDVWRILECVVAVIAVLWMFFISGSFALGILRGVGVSKHIAGMPIPHIMAYSFFGLTLLCDTIAKGRVNWWIVAPYSLSALSDFVIPYFQIPKGQRTPHAWMDSIQKREIQKDEWKNRIFPQSRLFVPIFLIGLATYFLSIFVSALGESSARRRYDYMLIKDNQHIYAVCRVYNGLFYAAEIEGEKRQFTGRYRVFNPSNGVTWEHSLGRIREKS